MLISTALRCFLFSISTVRLAHCKFRACPLIRRGRARVEDMLCTAYTRESRLHLMFVYLSINLSAFCELSFRINCL